MEIHVQVKLSGDGFPTREELAARHQLEDLLEDRRVGPITGAGGGMGVMDVYVEVANARAAMPVVRTLVAEAGLEARATVRVLEDYPDALPEV